MLSLAKFYYIFTESGLGVNVWWYDCEYVVDSGIECFFKCMLSRGIKFTL